jgi:hypothetical protein
VELADPIWLAKARKGSALVDFIFANGNGFGTVDESWFQNARESVIFDRPVLVIPAEENHLGPPPPDLQSTRAEGIVAAGHRSYLWR